MPVSPVIISQPAGYNIGYNPSPVKMPQAGGAKNERRKEKRNKQVGK